MRPVSLRQDKEGECVMKVFLDDVREKDGDWVIVRTFDAFVAAMETGAVTEVSLDHDLQGTDLHHNGMDAVRWTITHNVLPPVIRVHTANTSARPHMVRALSNAAPGSIVMVTYEPWPKPWHNLIPEEMLYPPTHWTATPFNSKGEREFTPVPSSTDFGFVFDEDDEILEVS